MVDDSLILALINLAGLILIVGTLVWIVCVSVWQAAWFVWYLLTDSEEFERRYH